MADEQQLASSQFRVPARSCEPELREAGGAGVRGFSFVWHTANCIIIDHFSAFEFELVALFLTLPLKNGWQWVKTARNLNLGVSRNRFCDFLADPDSRSFSRF